MKKVLFVLVCVLLMCAMAVSVSAVEAPGVEEETETVMTRTWEWITANRDTILSIAGEGVLLVMMIKSWFKQKKQSAVLDSVNSYTNETVSGQTAVVSKMNEMIALFNKHEDTEKRVEKYEAHIEEVVGAATDMMLSLLEMMTIIHTQNRNLPQGTKDRVTQLFADCMKKVEGHEGLATLSKGLQNSYKIIVSGGEGNVEKDNEQSAEGVGDNA